MQSLIVADAGILSNRGLVKIADLGTQLKELKIGDHDEASLKHLLCQGPSLQKLSIGLNNCVEEDVLEHLTNLAGSLEELEFVNPRVMGWRGRLAVLQLPKLKVLKKCFVRANIGCLFIDLSGGMLQNLRHLDLRYDLSVTDASLILVAQNCLKLEFLGLWICGKVRDLSDFVTTLINVINIWH